MSDEMREKIAKTYYNFTVRQGWELSGFEGDIRDKATEFTHLLIHLKTSNGYSLEEMIEFFEKIDCETQREAVVRKEPELPKQAGLPYKLIREEQLSKEGVVLGIKRMLLAGFVQEVEDE